MWERYTLHYSNVFVCVSCFRLQYPRNYEPCNRLLVNLTLRYIWSSMDHRHQNYRHQDYLLLLSLEKVMTQLIICLSFDMQCHAVLIYDYLFRLCVQLVRYAPHIDERHKELSVTKIGDLGKLHNPYLASVVDCVMNGGWMDRNWGTTCKEQSFHNKQKGNSFHRKMCYMHQIASVPMGEDVQKEEATQRKGNAPQQSWFTRTILWVIRDNPEFNHMSDSGC